MELRKKSYVNTMKMIKVPLDCLRGYHGRHALHCIFTATSYKELLESAQFQPPLSSPSQAMPSHPASPEFSWSNGSGLDPTNRPAFTSPWQNYQVQYAHRVYPVPITSTYAQTAATLPSQYTRVALYPPRVPARSSPSAFQADPYSNFELERQMRAIAAAHARSYGTMTLPNTVRNTRPETRRSTGHLPLPVQDEQPVGNTTDANCDYPEVFFIICFILIICFLLF